MPKKMEQIKNSIMRDHRGYTKSQAYAIAQTVYKKWKKKNSKKWVAKSRKKRKKKK
jgi:hypothetical protein